MLNRTAVRVWLACDAQPYFEKLYFEHAVAVNRRSCAKTVM